MALKKVYSEQAEMAVLGTMLGDQEKVSHCCSVLTSEDFYDESNRKIFEAIKDLFENKIKVDVPTLVNKLQSLNILDEIGGVPRLTSLVDYVTVENVTFYIDILKDKTNLRRLAEFLEKSYSEYNEKTGEDIHNYLDQIEKDMLSITRFRSVSDFMTTKDLADEFDRFIKDRDLKKPYISTGYNYLNKYLNGGWQNGNLIILAARTGVGKTALALNFALNCAKSKTPVAFFSAEMSAHELLGRMVSILGFMDSTKVATYDFKNNQDLMRLQHSLETLKELPIYIDDTANIKLLDLVTKARKLKSENPSLGLIFVDYLTIVEAQVNKNESRERQVAKVATTLKGLAKDLGVPIIAIAQLGRSGAVNKFGQKSTDKRPDLTDLRESGQIEQDADVVLFLYRESYNQTVSVENNEEIELIIRKNRSGKTGTIKMVGTPKYYQYVEKTNQDSNPDLGQ